MTTTTDEIVNYVMESPSNTNPAILRELLSEHGAGGATFYGPYSLHSSPEAVETTTVSPGETIGIPLNMVYDHTTEQDSSYPSDLLHEQFITIIIGYEIAYGLTINAIYEPSYSESGYPEVVLQNVGNADLLIGGVTNVPTIDVYSSVRLASEENPGD